MIRASSCWTRHRRGSIPPRSVASNTPSTGCGRTGIVIAHRLATVRRADTILVMEDGRVAEYGPRATLAADPASRFAQMLRTGHDQLLGEEETMEARR